MLFPRSELSDGAADNDGADGIDGKDSMSGGDGSGWRKRKRSNRKKGE